MRTRFTARDSQPEIHRMIPPLSSFGFPDKPGPAARQAPALRFGHGDQFVRFGESTPPEEDDDPELRELLKVALGNDPETVIFMMETMDILYFKALDDGDCDKARDYLARKDKLEADLAAEADALMPDLDLDAIIDRAIEARREYDHRAAEADMDWAKVLLDSDLIEPGMAETTGPGLQEERSAVSMQLIELLADIDEALADHHDGEALRLYAEFKATRNERDRLGYDD